MSDITTLKINPSKSSTLEFDVMIQGLEESTKPNVRFVVVSSGSDFSYAFNCAKSDKKNQWVVKLPAIPTLMDEDVTFHVEVIVDGYYFEPASGKIDTIGEPAVVFEQVAVKPTVTASFVVTQDDEPLAELDVTGQYAPSTNNLIPEYDPALPKGDAKTPQAEFDKNLEPPPEEFDPKKVAANIVKSTIGSAAKPTARGTLFTRDSAGKPVIAGIDSPDVKATKAANARRVKDILDSKT